jgi:4-hydroxybenzoate polyprenyltransferase
MILSGNIIIAALTAWVIVVVYFFAGAKFGQWVNITLPFDVKKFFKLTFMYAGFAFVVSLVREVIKDLEDMEGDVRYNCNTMPIAWGVPASKVFVAVWLIVCIALLVIVQLYAWQSGWWPVVLYSVMFVILPLVYLLKKLRDAVTPKDYHRLSSLVKFIMLAGILTMGFFFFF